MGDALEVTFETPIPLIGQVMVLEAVDYLYALMALAYTDWKEDYSSIENWREAIVNVPGKLLPRESNLHLTQMYPGSAKELLQGMARPAEKFVEFLFTYREKKVAAKIKNLSEATEYVQHQLLPLADKMRKKGVPDRNIERTLNKAYQFLDEVLDDLVDRKQIAIKLRDGSMIRGLCPTCGKQISQ
jgi:small nuclear ribonucleoprotein (snRNP)-like protein